MLYKDKTVYEGHWDKNKKQRYGYLKAPDESIYKGYFERDLKHGSGIEEIGDSYFWIV